jgi:membrane protein
LSESRHARQDHVVKNLWRRVQELIATLQAWAEQTIFWRVWERMLENEFVDRSVALAGKAFVSFFPAIIVVAAFSPPSVRTSIFTTLAHRMGLSGEGLTTVRNAFASADSVRKATGILGLILTFFYINSFTTALGRVYIKAWRRPPGRKLAGYALGASWLIGVAAYFAIIGLVRRAASGGFETGIFAVIAAGAAVGLWWLTAWLMLDRHVRWRPLFATAVLTAIASVLFTVSAQVWMPRTMQENQRQFGTFGVTLALVTYLTGVGLIIVVAACAGAEVAEDRGPIGRWLRGPSDEVLMPGAVPSLPPPARAFRLADAIGRGREDNEDL